MFAPILVAPNWEKDEKDHHHSIYIASPQLVQVERNYTVTKNEALGMIFSVQEFRHYLLGYKFMFHVINKPQLSGRIAIVTRI